MLLSKKKVIKICIWGKFSHKFLIAQPFELLVLPGMLNFGTHELPFLPSKSRPMKILTSEMYAFLKLLLQLRITTSLFEFK